MNTQIWVATCKFKIVNEKLKMLLLQMLENFFYGEALRLRHVAPLHFTWVWGVVDWRQSCFLRQLYKGRPYKGRPYKGRPEVGKVASCKI